MIRPSAALARLRPGEWWTGRSPRERALLGAMAVAAAGYLGVTGVAKPLLAARAEALASIGRSDQALTRLAALPAGVGGTTDAPADGPVTPIVTDTAGDFGLTIRRIEPDGAGARLSIDDADFDAVVTWIDALEADNGLRVVAIEMDRRPEPGVVSVNLTVQR